MAGSDPTAQPSQAPTPQEEDALLAAARAACAQAYAPYSQLRVGAALLDETGAHFSGANIENAAYPVGICAERAALAAAVTAGTRAWRLLALASDGPAPCIPCGLCRQTLAEFGLDLVVVSEAADGGRQRYVLGRDLLPHSFGPGHLPAG